MSSKKFTSEVKNISFQHLSINQKWIDIKDKRIIQIGFGGIGGCMLPLYRRHIKMNHPSQVIIFEMDKSKIPKKNKQLGAIFIHFKVTKENYKQTLKSVLREGDILVDLAWYIDTLSLLKLCHSTSSLFVNAAVEEWESPMEDPKKDPREYTLYSRQLKIQEQAKEWKHQGPTALLTIGANPGVVSILYKLALKDWVHWIDKNSNKEGKEVKEMKACLQLLEQNEVKNDRELSKKIWARLSALINVQVIQVTERDTLISAIPRERNTFVCTWSPAGLAEEAIAPAELGWGTHEIMTEGVYTYSKGPKNQVCFSTRGWNTHVESYTPVNGNFMASCIRHEEAYSLSDYFTDHSSKTNKVTYRPTVYYAYLPCDQCVASMQELQSNGYKYPKKDRIPRDDVISGEDEVGIFLLSRDYGEYYLGTKQNIEQSRKLLNHQSPTLLVVAAGVLSGIIYAYNHPNMGVIHPEEMDEEEAIQMIAPYWYPMIGGHISGWKPTIKSKYDEDKSKIRVKDWIYEKLRLD